MTKKARPFVLALLLLSFLGAPTVLAAEDSAVENMFPSRSPVDGENELYEQFNLDSYYFDDNYGFTEVFREAWNSLWGMAFVVEMAFLKLVIYISQLIMVLKIFDPLASLVSDQVQKLGSSVFGTILDGLLIIMSTWIFIQLFRRRIAQTAKEVAWAILVLAIGTSFFANLYTYMTNVHGFTQAVSGQLLLQAMETANGRAIATDEPEKAGQIQAGNKIWENYAIIPWQLATFGKAMKPGSEISPDSPDPIARDTYLLLSATEKERENLVKSWTEGDNPRYPSMTSWSGLIGRTAVTFLNGVAILIFGFFYLILSLFVFVTKMLFLITSAMAPFVFLFGVLPGAGVFAVFNWIKEWLKTGLYGIVAAFLVSMYMLLSTKMWSFVDDYGWLLGGLVPQLLLVGVLAWKPVRDRVIQFFKAPFGAPGHVIRNIPAQPFQVVQEKTGESVQRVVERTFERKRRRAAENSGVKKSGGVQRGYLQRVFGGAAVQSKASSASRSGGQSPSSAGKSGQPLRARLSKGPVRPAKAPSHAFSAFASQPAPASGRLRNRQLIAPEHDIRGRINPSARNRIRPAYRTGKVNLKGLRSR
ncbi:MAG: hypothetical protein ACOYEF_10200 [Planifilum sp.]